MVHVTGFKADLFLFISGTLNYLFAKTFLFNVKQKFNYVVHWDWKAKKRWIPKTWLVKQKDGELVVKNGIAKKRAKYKFGICCHFLRASILW